jgi:SNF2 family DNA or RNA helicase
VDEWFKTVTNRFNPTATDIRGLKGCVPGCKSVPGGHCQHYAAFARANLGRRFLQRLRDDVLTDLPPLTGPIRTECRMGRDQSRMYRELRDELVTETPDGQEMLAWTTSAKTVMLDQLTTGAGVVDLGDGAPPTTKLSAKLEYDLRGRARPTLVVAHYRRSVEAAAQVSRLVGATPAVVHGGIGPLERGRAVRDFQEGRADVLVGSLGTISEGLNLTQADMVIFLEHSYRPSLNQQALRRIHRIGQDRPCVALDYVAVTDRGGRTIDGNKRELLEGKTDEQVRTLSAARLLAS